MAIPVVILGSANNGERFCYSVSSRKGSAILVSFWCPRTAETVNVDSYPSSAACFVVAFLDANASHTDTQSFSAEAKQIPNRLYTHSHPLYYICVC